MQRGPVENERGNMNESDIIFKPVGIVKTIASDNDIRERYSGLESTIEVFPEFAEALEGIDGFSHIFVLTYFHRLTADQIGVLKVRPRRLPKAPGFEEPPLVGAFATSSPHRPNPIGLSLVILVFRDENKLVVRGLDCFNGTPVLDIKPYKDDYRADDYRIASWYHRLIHKAEGRP
jgi:tRNA-Thr(GGU) m(6)t(6)A37 methyltransferase TsaA